MVRWGRNVVEGLRAAHFIQNPPMAPIIILAGVFGLSKTEWLQYLGSYKHMIR